MVKAEHGFFHDTIEGLRDPLAADPNALLQAAHLNPEKVTARWDEYQALHPKLLEQRARRLLEPPDTVQLSITNGVLYAKGAASPEWVAEARKLVRGLAGVNQFTYTGDLQADIKSVENGNIRFASGRAELTPEAMAEVKRLAQLWQNIAAQAPGSRMELTGRADSSGAAQTNETLSRQRAEAVRDALVATGLPAAQISVQGARASQTTGPSREDADSRKVTFRVLVKTGQP